MRDEETVHEFIERTRREDDAVAVAAILAAILALSTVIAMVMLLRPGA